MITRSLPQDLFSKLDARVLNCALCHSDSDSLVSSLDPVLQTVQNVFFSCHDPCASVFTQWQCNPQSSLAHHGTCRQALCPTHAAKNVGMWWNLWVCAWYATSAGQLQVSMLHDTDTSLMYSGLLCIVKLALQMVPASATAACHSCYRCPEVPAKS